MNNESDEDNLMRMTKEELQCWIQAEVERNPQLIQRHEQLAQVEEWVKQKEKDATCTRLLYSNACESVLECESVMKGLYVMLGLEYQEEDSEEEEGGGVKEPQDVIQIPDEDEEDSEEKSPCDDDNDIVVIDLGATNECLEPMLEKVTVAMEKSSRLVQDLVQMVTKTSSKNESFLDVSIRPSSTSISSESLTPVPCFSPRNQQPITESSIEIIKTESLSMAKTPETIGTHNTELTTTINTEPSDMFFLQNNCKDHRTAVSDACPSIASIKTEPQLKEVSPAFFSKSGNFMGTFKTEPDFMPVISGISSLSSDFKPDSENRGTLKTESQSKIQSYISNISNISSPEKISSYTSESLATLKTEQLITKMKTEQPEIILSHSLDPINTNKNEPHSSVSSKTPLIPSDSEQSNTIQDHNSATENLPSLCNSEQDNKISTDKSPSMNKAAADGRSSTRSPESSEKNKTRQKSSLKASSKTSRSQKVRQRSPSPDSSDESGEVSDSSVRSGDSYHPPLKSSKNMAKKSTSNVNRLSLKITNPVPASAAPPPAPSAPESPAAKPSDVKQISTDSSSSSLKVTKEIKLGVDAYVLAKVKSKTWYRGKVVETQTKGNGHRYKVEFKNGKKCLIPAHHLACLKPPLLKDLFIGCRVVASLKGEQEKICFKAAVMVELPDRKNRMRFLVFCDDGQAAYCALPDLHLVCKQFKHVWKDIDDETSRSQVKEYLGAFPNPIVVVLRIAQDTKAKRDGKFEPCTVLQLDGSLVQIKFKDDHKEWVYKGSNKLEHIVNIKKRLAEQKTQQPANTGSNTSATSSGVSQKSDTPATKNRPPSPQNTTISPVSSTSVTQQAGGTVAKAPTLSPENITSAASPQPASPQTDSLSSPSSQNTTPDASPSRVTPQTFSRVSKAPSLNLENATSAAFQPMVVLQKLDRHLSIPPVRSGSTPNLRTAKRPIDDEVEEDVSERNQAKSTNLCHRCCPTCLDGVRPKNVDIHHGHNPLQIPLLFKFRRMTARRRLEGKVFFHIFYRSPCGRSLCDMEEVQNYLFETRCDFLFLEMFCMDPFVLVNRARPPSASTSQPYLYLPDISQGREVLPVPCINEVDKTPAPSVRYTKDRILAPGVSINTSLDFMTGCDCTDGCQDRTKCSCHQLTIEGTSLCSDGPVDVTAGYLHKRLQTTLPTGVYECNPLCRCDPRICSNRLVQHGLQLRLELFMTQHKGWGIRCKDDVAKGTFICVFTGKVVTEDKVNEDDMVSGNEYLANLDFIEGVEKLKEGYESEAFCSDTENDNNKKTLTMKTGPLWKNTLFQDDSSSGEEKYEPMELDDKQKKINVCDKASRERKLSHRPQEKSEGQKVPGPKRCFAIKSFERRVKALERVDGQNVKTKKAQPTKNTRRLFDGEEMCYIIDARQEGNLGRFINHSCSPNLVVQNVFVDTHDLRFPWVAFFASKRIKAGTELTWDYNYEVGSVEGKVLLCCCGSSRCTGRLL